MALSFWYCLEGLAQALQNAGSFRSRSLYQSIVIHHHLRQSCRACDSSNIFSFLSLGPMPLANSFLRSPDEFSREISYPLDVYFCNDCSLVQLMDVIDPEVLVRNYIYVTGTSETMAAHHRQYANTLVNLLGLTQKDLVIEIAS